MLKECKFFLVGLGLMQENIIAKSIRKHGGAIATKRKDSTQTWDETITHILVDKALDSAMLNKKLFLESDGFPNHVHVVTLHWLSICDKTRTRQPESDRLYAGLTIPVNSLSSPTLPPLIQEDEQVTKRRRTPTTEIGPELLSVSFPPYAPDYSTIHAAAPKTSNFKEALAPYISSPESFPQIVYTLTPDLVVLYDRYPKSTYHALILPRATYLQAPFGIKQLNWTAHRAQITAMHELADSLVAAWCTASAAFGVKNRLTPSHFQIGYHAVPSLHSLHLHVISRDFRSQCLNKKEHWNSFTTPFFVSAAGLETEFLKDSCAGAAIARNAPSKKAPIRCPLCHHEPANLSSMKLHYDGCYPRWTNSLLSEASL